LDKNLDLYEHLFYYGSHYRRELLKNHILM
jgi:hypothetical protein